MPTISAHVTDHTADAVIAAARISKEAKVGPYIAEAVRQRMAREGTAVPDPRAELFAAAEEVGIDNALAALAAVRGVRRKKLRAVA